MTDAAVASRGLSGDRLARIMRAARKAHRLEVVREVVEGTIHDLRARDPREIMGRRLSWSEELTDGPIRAALEVCCDELRDGCGLSAPGPHSDHETRALQPAGSWTDYMLALGRYRESASVALETSFQRLAPRASERAAAR